MSEDPLVRARHEVELADASLSTRWPGRSALHLIRAVAALCDAVAKLEDAQDDAPDRFVCKHCGEESDAEQPCPGRDDPGPCEPPLSEEYRQGFRDGLLWAAAVASAKAEDGECGNARGALAELSDDLRAERDRT